MLATADGSGSKNGLTYTPTSRQTFSEMRSHNTSSELYSIIHQRHSLSYRYFGLIYSAGSACHGIRLASLLWCWKAELAAESLETDPDYRAGQGILVNSLEESGLEDQMFVRAVGEVRITFLHTPAQQQHTLSAVTPIGACWLSRARLSWSRAGRVSLSRKRTSTTGCSACYAVS